MPLNELAQLIRPSGYYNQKAKKLKNFVNYLKQNYGGSISKMSGQDLFALRENLLEINGIGMETADSILLYAMNKPIFVVDAYTKRIFTRLGLIDQGWKYPQIQDFFMKRLPKSIELYNDFHAQIVILGKEICRKRPGCPICPIIYICDHGKSIAGEKGIKCRKAQ